MNTARTAITLVGTVLAGRTAVRRIIEARRDGDSFELLDAALNAAVVVTGVIVVLRRHRRDAAA